MFYDFNRQKQHAVKSEPVAMDELVRRYNQHRKAGQRHLANQMSARLSRLPITLQRALFFIGLVIGTGYCIYLILPNSFRQQGKQSLPELTNSHRTIQAVSPSPMQQALEQYLDSLEKAFIADSIFQSQQTTKDHAEKSIHP